ncbi:hypothetical protein LAZ67_4002764 [Cordylochernes scorpioides]|uniref:Uncharacterized protein n=1 Tax=Cordylochernes scorpioides TaxID=51811 RepID=A0ABY6KG43_9ARAC|nr:hypothetical protein LAZ67_4002764 [Cordylochernes scorpioides]
MITVGQPSPPSAQKDDSLRPCGYYRKLNAASDPDRYPVPNIMDFASHLHVIVAVYACGVDVEKGPIRQQLWDAPPCDNVESSTSGTSLDAVCMPCHSRVQKTDCGKWLRGNGEPSFRTPSVL